MKWLNGITDSMDEFMLIPGDSEGQDSLVCFSPWGRKKSDTTEQLNNKSEQEARVQGSLVTSNCHTWHWPRYLLSTQGL